MKTLSMPVFALCLVATGALAAAGPTDPQIAAIVVTANQVDIDAGKLAESKAQSAEVRKFAEAMVTDHGAVNKAAGDLVHKLNVTPESNATSDSLKKGGDENMANIKKMQGAAFDRAYVDHEVAYHEAVIDALDKTLIPSAQNSELKALLVKVRPSFVAHLEHAKHLQAHLEKAHYAARAEHVSRLTRDLAEVVAAEDLTAFRDAGQGRRVAFQCPCTMQHGQGLGGVVEDILRRCGYALTHIPDAGQCCGSAGTYSLLQPELSQRLLDRKLEAVMSGELELIATANIGCQMQLATEAKLPVRHWIELL